MQLSKIPATIVTGFLGSGKTTLISNILKQAAGRKIAVIVNEFGELDIDADLLRGCPLDCARESTQGGSVASGIYELANGCICCTVEEEFLPVMQTLLERRRDIDHILIETSGLALPKPLVQAFNWPEIKRYCTVDAVITLIDGPAVAAGRFAADVEKVQAQRAADASLDHDPSLQELLDDQLSAADLVVVGKNDLLSSAQRAQVAQMVAAKVPAAVKTIYTGAGQAVAEKIPLDCLLGMRFAAEDGIEQVHSHHEHNHVQGKHHAHAHDYFTSCVISLGEVDSQRLQMCLMELLEQFNIFRIKGFAAIPNKPMRQLIQAVGKRLAIQFDRLWGADEARLTQLVIIGKNIDKKVLTQLLGQTALKPVV